MQAAIPTPVSLSLPIVSPTCQYVACGSVIYETIALQSSRQARQTGDAFYYQVLSQYSGEKFS